MAAPRVHGVGRSQADIGTGHGIGEASARGDGHRGATPAVGKLLKSSANTAKTIGSKLDIPDKAGAVGNLLGTSAARTARLKKQGVLDDVGRIVREENVPVTAGAEEIKELFIDRLAKANTQLDD